MSRMGPWPGAQPGAHAGSPSRCEPGAAGADEARLVASCCSYLDLFHLRSLSQGGKLRLAQGRLREPDVQWTLVVVRDFGGDKASVRLANVTGPGRGAVRFTGRIDTETTFRAAHPGTERAVGPDGLIDELTNFLNGQQSKMQIHVAVYRAAPGDDADDATSQGDDLSADLGKLLDQGVLSDVVLRARHGHDMPAHRAVLAARSPVFQGLFLADMAESRSSTVTVDFPANVMERVLRYAYTGHMDRTPSPSPEAATTTTKTDESADDEDREVADDGDDDAAGQDVAAEAAEAATEMDVLAAADYYQLAGLKRLCEERLLRRVRDASAHDAREALAPEEVLRTVVLADRYGAPALKERALDVAAGSLKQLRSRPEWKDFAHEHPDLVAELMGVMADKLEQALERQQGQQQGQQGLPYLGDGLHNDVLGQIFGFNRVIRFS